MTDKAPSRWHPGRAFVWRQDTHAVFVRRHLLGGSGKAMCDVHEAIFPSPAEADRYLRCYGHPEAAPQPWGTRPAEG